MHVCRVQPEPLIRGIAHCVKSVADSEDTKIEVSFRDDHVVLGVDDGRNSATYRVEAEPVEGYTMPTGTWLMPAASLRDALRRQDTGVMRSACMLALTPGPVAELAVHATTLSDTTDDRRISVHPLPTKPELTPGPHELVVSAISTQWTYLGEFAGDNGAVCLDPSTHMAFAFRADGSTAMLPLGRRWNAPPDEDNNALTVRSGEIPPLDDYLKRQHHPDLRYHQTNLFSDEEEPFLSPSKRKALEQAQLRAATNARQADIARKVSPGHRGVVLRGSTVQAIAKALDAEFAPVAAQVRAETRQLKKAGKKITGPEGSQRLLEARVPAVISPVGDHLVLRVGNFTLSVPSHPETERLAALAPSLHADFAEATQQNPAEPKGPALDAVSWSPHQLSFEELRSLAEWAHDGERYASMYAPDAEAFVALGSPDGESIHATAVRPTETDGKSLGDEMRSSPLGKGTIPPVAASAKLLAASLLNAPTIGKGWVGVCQDGRFAIRQRGLQVYLASPSDASLETQPLTRTAGLAVAQARSGILRPRGGNEIRDQEVRELVEDETARGQDRDATHQLSRRKGHRRAPRNDTPYSRHLAEEFGMDARLERGGADDEGTELESGAKPEAGPNVPDEEAVNFEALVARGRDLRLSESERQAARTEIVQNMAGFAYLMVNETSRTGVSFADRLSIALLSLSEAMNHGWKPEKGASLLTYLRRVYRSRLTEALPAAGGYQLSFAGHSDSRITDVVVARNALWDRTGHEPSPAEIAEELGKCPDVASVVALRDDEERRVAQDLREKATRWVEERLAVHESAWALSLHGSSQTDAPSVPHLGDRIADVSRENSPGEVSRMLNRVLERVSASERDLLRAEAGFGAFELNTHEYALYSGMTIDTTAIRSQKAHDRLRRDR